MRTLLAWLTMAAVAWAQPPTAITLPDEVDVGDKLVASVDAEIPAGAQFKGGWEIECESGPVCKASWEPLAKANTIGIWAPAGLYTVKFSGMWVHWEQQEFDFIQLEASVKVGTPVPPPPEGPWRIWMIENPQQRDNLPQSQQALLTSATYRQAWEEREHKFMELVSFDRLNGSTRLQALARAVSGSGVGLPTLVLAPIDRDEFKVYPLPENVEAMDSLLDNPPEADK